MALVGLKVIFIFKCKSHYRSPVLRQTLDKTIDHEFSLPLGEFYMFCVHLMYTPCSKLPNCHISTKHAEWQLRWQYTIIISIIHVVRFQMLSSLNITFKQVDNKRWFLVVIDSKYLLSVMCYWNKVRMVGCQVMKRAQ